MVTSCMFDTQSIISDFFPAVSVFFTPKNPSNAIFLKTTYLGDIVACSIWSFELKFSFAQNRRVGNAKCRFEFILHECLRIEDNIYVTDFQQRFSPWPTLVHSENCGIVHCFKRMGNPRNALHPMNLFFIRLVLFHLCFASLTFGILLQQITHFLFFLVSLAAACVYGIELKALVGKGKQLAGIFFITILLSAIMAQWRFNGRPDFEFHWAFLAFWLVTPFLMARTNWVLVHRLMLGLSLPGLIYSYYWMVRPDEIAWAMEKGFHMFPRAEGFVSNPITNAATLILIACWSFGRLTSEVPRWERLLIWVHISLSTIIVVVSRVRIGIIGFLFLFLVVALLSEKLRKRALIIVPFVVILCAGSLYFFGFNMGSIEERLKLLNNGFQLIAAHPVFGIGPDLFAWFVIDGGDLVGHPHNTVVGITAELGFVGLTAYLVFMAAVGWAVWKLWCSQNFRAGPHGWLAKSLLLMYLTYWLVGMTDYNFADTELLLAHSFQFAMAIILALNLTNETQATLTANGQQLGTPAQGLEELELGSEKE